MYIPNYAQTNTSIHFKSFQTITLKARRLYASIFLIQSYRNRNISKTVPLFAKNYLLWTFFLKFQLKNLQRADYHSDYQGINFHTPLARKETNTAVSKEHKASNQFPLAIFTPVPANDRPIKTITGPITIGGKSRSIKLIPHHFINQLIKK